MSKKFPGLDRFIYYLNERWSIHQKRLKDLPPPWTNDQALRKYRFCQIRREDDRVTRWIHENWLRPHADDPDLWHAMCVARIGFNLPATLEIVKWPEPWGRRGRAVMEAARKRKATGAPMITGAVSRRPSSSSATTRPGPNSTATTRAGARTSIPASPTVRANAERMWRFSIM